MNRMTISELRLDMMNGALVEVDIETNTATCNGRKCFTAFTSLALSGAVVKLDTKNGIQRWHRNFDALAADIEAELSMWADTETGSPEHLAQLETLRGETLDFSDEVSAEKVAEIEMFSDYLDAIEYLHLHGSYTLANGDNLPLEVIEPFESLVRNDLADVQRESAQYVYTLTTEGIAKAAELFDAKVEPVTETVRKQAESLCIDLLDINTSHFQLYVQDEKPQTLKEVEFVVQNAGRIKYSTERRLWVFDANIVLVRSMNEPAVTIIREMLTQVETLLDRLEKLG